jgi:hypothetical protein
VLWAGPPAAPKLYPKHPARSLSRRAGCLGYSLGAAGGPAHSTHPREPIGFPGFSSRWLVEIMPVDHMSLRKLSPVFELNPENRLAPGGQTGDRIGHMERNCLARREYTQYNHQGKAWCRRRSLMIILGILSSSQTIPLHMPNSIASLVTLADGL